MQSATRDLQTQVGKLSDQIDEMRLDLDRQRHTLNLILAQLAQLVDSRPQVFPF
jgi:uncharacterized coiled-coil protein SlyX